MPCCFVYVAPLVTQYIYIYNTTRFFVSFVQTIYVMFWYIFFSFHTCMHITICSQLGSRRFSIFIYGWVLLCRVIDVRCVFWTRIDYTFYICRHIGIMEMKRLYGMGALVLTIYNINNGHDGVERLGPYACIKCTCLLSINAKN